MNNFILPKHTTVGTRIPSIWIPKKLNDFSVQILNCSITRWHRTWLIISTWFFKLNGIGWSEPFKYRTIRKSYRPLLFEYWICLVFGSPYKDITYCEDRKNIKYVKISKNCKTWIEARYCSEKLFIISLFKLLHLYWLKSCINELKPKMLKNYVWSLGI